MAKKEKKTFTSKEQAFSSLLKKERSRLYKKQAQEKLANLRAGGPSTALLGQAIAREQAAKRQRAIGIIGSKAEQLEIWAVNLDEVPLLHSMERERTKATTPPNKFIARTEKEVTDSFPD